MNWVTHETSDLIAGGVLEIGDGYRAKNSEMSKDGVSFVRAGDVNGRVNTIGTDRLSISSVKKAGRKRSMSGDVVMTTKGTVGRLAFVKSHDPDFIYSPQLCFWRVIDREVIEPRWLFYAMSSQEMLDQISWSSGQTDMAPYISLKDQRTAFKLTLPPINEQREIAAVLGAIDDKIELNRKITSTLEAMSRALYRSWFVDFEPVHARSQSLQSAYIDEATAALFPDCFGDNGLPKWWTLRTLSAVCSQVKKTVKPMDSPSESFLHFSLPAFDAGQSPVREYGVTIKSNKVFVPHDAVLFSRLNPRIPRVWWARTDRSDATPAASTEFFVATAKRSIDTPWLYCLLSSPEFHVDALSRVTGTSNSHQRVPPKALAEIDVIYPTSEIVEAFGKITGNWFDRVHALAGENHTLATLRDTLLPRLMSGELRVDDAREQVEEVL